MEFDQKLVTTDEADRYFNPRPFGNEWSGFSEDEKTAKILNASDQIIFGFKLQDEFIEEPPRDVKLATFLIIQYYTPPTDEPIVKRVRIDVIEEEYAVAEGQLAGTMPQSIIDQIESLLDGYLLSNNKFVRLER